MALNSLSAPAPEQAGEKCGGAGKSRGGKPCKRRVPRRGEALLCRRGLGLGLGARHRRLLLGRFLLGRFLLGLGLAGLFLGLGLLGRRDDRVLGDSFVIRGVDRDVARADGLTRLVDDVLAELFLVAIINDFAAFRRQDAGTFDLDGARSPCRLRSWQGRRLPPYLPRP